MDGNRDGGILIVCAANVCRSPMAGLTLRRAFARLPDYDAVPVATAGVSVDGARLTHGRAALRARRPA